MKKTLFSASLFLTALLAMFSSTAVTKGSFSMISPAKCSQENCSDPWAQCKQKVKVVGRVGDCVTFACEVGTKNEHLIKTNSKEGTKALLKLAEEKVPVESLGPSIPAVEFIWPDSF